MPIQFSLIWRMSAALLKFPSSPDPLNDTGDSIDHAYVGLVYCLAGFPDPLPIHRLEADEAALLGFRLLTE